MLESQARMLQMLFVKPTSKSRGSRRKKDDDHDEDEDEDEDHPRAAKRRKTTKKATKKRGKKKVEYEEIITSDEDSIGEVNWIRTYREEPAPTPGQSSDDILELSSD